LLGQQRVGVKILEKVPPVPYMFRQSTLNILSVFSCLSIAVKNLTLAKYVFSIGTDAERYGTKYLEP
jgi:hypothetical protein